MDQKLCSCSLQGIQMHGTQGSNVSATLLEGRSAGMFALIYRSDDSRGDGVTEVELHREDRDN